MKLSIDFKNISVLNKLKGNFAIILWVFLLIIAALTGIVIYQEVGKVTVVQTDADGILDRIVRVKLSNHESLEKKLSENSSFQSVSVDGADAFGMPPEPAREN